MYNNSLNSSTNSISNRISSNDIAMLFEVNTESEVIDESQSLWRAVITQALMDAGSNSKKNEFIKAKAEAIGWLTNNCEDFIETCLLAGYCPDIIRQKAIKVIKRGCIWRKPKNPFAKKKGKVSKKTEQNKSTTVLKRKLETVS